MFFTICNLTLCTVLPTTFSNSTTKYHTWTYAIYKHLLTYQKGLERPQAINQTKISTQYIGVCIKGIRSPLSYPLLKENRYKVYRRRCEV